MKVRINPEYQKLVRPLTQEEYELLKESIKAHDLLHPIIVNPKGIVLDGHHRLKACRELHKNYETKVIDLGSVEAEKNFIINSNIRRSLSLFEMIESLVRGEPRTHRQLAEELNVSRSQITRAIEIIERGDEKLKELVRNGTLKIFQGWNVLTALESIENEEDRKAMLDSLYKGEIDYQEFNRIIGETNAIISLLDGEPDEVREEAEKKLKPLYYTPEIDVKEANWIIEEIAKTGHVITKGRKWADEIGETWEEAQEWFAHYGGYCIGEVKGWEGEWDKQQEKLERLGKIKTEGEKQNAKTPTQSQ
jgi:ParB/RepB/Spo0J family partition protein